MLSAMDWMIRAEETRELARRLTDSEARQGMLRVAEDYEKLAQRAASRALSGKPLDQPAEQ